MSTFRKDYNWNQIQDIPLEVRHLRALENITSILQDIAYEIKYNK